MFDAKADPNKLSEEGQMAPLHQAVQMKASDVIELLLTCDRTEIDVMSPSHGTPLHLACRGGSVKIVQQLLLNNADYTVKNSKGKVPKEVTKNQRIIYLIEKYEKKMIKTATGSFQSSKSNEEEKESGVRLSLSGQGSAQHKYSPSISSIREEDIIYEEEEIENQAGGVLDQAEEFIKDFTDSRIELVPTVKGHLLAQGQLTKKQRHLYFVLKPC